MRDVHRMKEKVDLSLDNRQVVSLLITGIVILGAVFVLGVIVGKKLGTGEPSEHAPDLLTALDQKAAAQDAAKEEPPLTFQDELTKKAAQPLPAPVPSEVLAAQPATPEPEEEVVAVPAPTPTPAVPTRTTSKDALREALARVRSAPETTANGQFTLQLAASQNRTEADRFIARLRDKGYAPYVVEATVPAKGTWYRVRMGSFATKDAAQRYLQDFRRETQLDGFVTGTE